MTQSTDQATQALHQELEQIRQRIMLKDGSGIRGNAAKEDIERFRQLSGLLGAGNQNAPEANAGEGQVIMENPDTGLPGAIPGATSGGGGGSGPEQLLSVLGVEGATTPAGLVRRGLVDERDQVPYAHPVSARPCWDQVRMHQAKNKRRITKLLKGFGLRV